MKLVILLVSEAARFLSPVVSRCPSCKTKIRRCDRRFFAAGLWWHADCTFFRAP